MRLHNRGDSFPHVFAVSLHLTDKLDLFQGVVGLNADPLLHLTDGIDHIVHGVHLNTG